MNKQVLAALFHEGGKILSSLIQTYGVTRPRAAMIQSEGSKEESPETEHITTDATIRYQRREIAKELILLEGHLQQGCKIDGKACDCCEKHPIKIEGLAQETAGMTPDPVFTELADWVGQISPMTTESASASGKYDDEYPSLAIKAREFRKAIMTPDIMKEVVNEEIPPGGEGPNTEVPL